MTNKYQEFMEKLFNEYLINGSSIKLHADKVYLDRQELNKELTDENNYQLTSTIKNIVHGEAVQAIENNEGNGIVIGATGVGKTKIAIDRMNKAIGKLKNPNFLVVVPTQALRDVGWVEEIKRWGKKGLINHVTLVCYDSLDNFMFQSFTMVVFDECHNLTESNSKFLGRNYIGKKIGLTATYPTNKIRAKLVDSCLGRVVYHIDTDTSVKLGLVSPYNIVIVNAPMYKNQKTVMAGSKAKPFATTEINNYNYLSALCNRIPSKFNYLKRMRFIYNLKSKEYAAKWILDNLIPAEERTLIFAGSKDQANNLCRWRYYSKPSKPKQFTPEKTAAYIKSSANYQGDESLNNFNNKLIDRLACVEALNEGHNINEIDCGLIVQLNSNELNLVQRIGRCIRYRAGHIGSIIIICANETVDKEWVMKATANLTMNIRTVEFKDLYEGVETI